MTNTAGEPSTDDPLEHALALARCKLRVLPIRPGGKHPPMNSWQHAATTDEKTIRNWWGGPYRGYGVGIAMGLQPDGRRVFAVDVDEHDPANSGSEALHELESIHGELPVTVWSLTGGGGMHLLFDSGNVEVTNGALAPGVDIRGQGGQIVVAPSLHPSGKRYAWDQPPMLVPIAKAPEWLLELVKPQPATDTPAPSTESFNNHLNTPADVLRASWDWPSELRRRGWQHVRSTANGDTHWTRPGKDPREGTSGTLHPGGPFVVFTTDASVSDMWKAGKVGKGCVSLSPLALVAAYDHGGDLGAAAKALYIPYFERPITLDLDPPVEDYHNPPLDHIPYFERPITLDLDPPVEDYRNPLLDQLIIWSEFWAKDHKAEDWLLWPLIPVGRQTVLYAPAKTGKSIVALAGVAALATGRSIFGAAPTAPRHVLYLDYEMTETDLYERLDALGYGPDDDWSHLHYVSIPSLPPLHVVDGATAVCTLVALTGAELVVVDTMGRAVIGEENESTAYMAFAQTTGLALKARGVAVLRTDHAGKDPKKGQRGSSAKNDDVDIVYLLKTCEGGWILERTHARMGWVPDLLMVRRRDEDGYIAELAIEQTRRGDGYAAGTKELVAEFEALGIDGTWTNTAASSAIKKAGLHVSNKRRTDALRWMREQLTSEALEVGERVGNDLSTGCGQDLGNVGEREECPAHDPGERVRNAGNACGTVPGNVCIPKDAHSPTADQERKEEQEDWGP